MIEPKVESLLTDAAIVLPPSRGGTRASLASSSSGAGSTSPWPWRAR